MTPKDTILSLEDDFFDNVESCSTEPANLDEVIFLFYKISLYLNFPFVSIK